MTAKIFFKLIFAVLCVLVIALVSVDFLASRVAENTYLDTLKRELADKGRTLSAVIAREDGVRDEGLLRELAKGSSLRLTLVARDGRVVFDSDAPARTMENHAGRPEIAAALQGREESTIRKSGTLEVPYLYVAVPSGEGALRLAVPLSKIEHQVNAIRRRMLASVALAFLPAILVAAYFARYVSHRLAGIIDYSAKLAQGNFQARLEKTGVDELGLLGAKLNETGKKLETMFEELQREHAELEKLERIRKDFVINVSHELRTPLASIQGYTETLLDGAVYDAKHNLRFLQIIRQNAERLSNLTADLLTLSRVELKQQKFHFAAYNLPTLVTDSVDSMRPIAGKKRITLVLDPCPDGAEAFCDKEAVNQIVTNLLDNAIKYTPETGHIHVGIRPQAKVMEVYVRDSGIGIPLAELPRLFERFYRVDKARSRELGGTGLGLTIVKHLVRAQGGDVKVDSVQNQGSEFSFTLPVEDLGLSEHSDIRSQLTSS